MPGHFSDIGLKVENDNDVIILADQIFAHGTRQSHNYYLWEIGEGIEVWLTIETGKIFEGITPAYAGTSHIPIRIMQWFAEPGYPHEGKIYCWVNPEGESDGTGDYPLCCDIVGSAIVESRLKAPINAILQLTAFAESLEYFASDEEAMASQQGEDEPHFAIESFIPSGLFIPEGSQATQPTAHAILSGHILTTERRVNLITGHEFYAMTVQTHGATLDVVANPVFLPQTPIIRGVVKGEFWLCGRLLGLPPQKSWWQRLFRN